MSKFDEKISFYKENMVSMGLPYKDELFDKITKGLGLSIFKRDAASVSISDEKEVFTVKHNFLINKLGLEDGEYLDEAIIKVGVLMGKTNRVKYRAIFYYLLVKGIRPRVQNFKLKFYYYLKEDYKGCFLFFFTKKTFLK